MKLIVLFKVIIFATLLIFTHSQSEAKSHKPPKHQPLSKYKFSKPKLGTLVQIVLYTKDENHANELAHKCFVRVDALNDIFSDYDANSEVSLLSKKPIGKAHKVSQHLITVISKAESISAQTNGAFDITIGDYSRSWRERNLKDKKMSVNTDYNDLLIDYEEKTITLEKSLKIDLGGIAKGYIADQIMSILKQAGVNHAAVVIGGETILGDPPPEKKGWHIGIENPEQKIIGKMIISNTALSTSGDSYQFFITNGIRSSHLIDPKSKKSMVNRLNVTTIAASAMEADGWATALRILPLNQATKIAKQQTSLKTLFIPYKKSPISINNFPRIQSHEHSK